MKYRVVLAAGSENGLVGIGMFDPDSVSEFEEFDEDNNEIYSIETEYDIDRVLDLSETVIEYVKDADYTDEGTMKNNPKLAKFEFFQFGDYPMARIKYPNGRVQEVRRETEANLDEIAFLYVDGHQYIYLGTMSHATAQCQELTNEEWDYTAEPGTVGGYIY